MKVARRVVGKVEVVGFVAVEGVRQNLASPDFYPWSWRSPEVSLHLLFVEFATVEWVCVVEVSRWKTLSLPERCCHRYVGAWHHQNLYHHRYSTRARCTTIEVCCDTTEICGCGCCGGFESKKEEDRKWWLLKKKVGFRERIMMRR